jgi:uncharacterized protein
MKISRYNHFTTSFFPGKYLAFNALTGAYLEFNDDRLAEADVLFEMVQGGALTDLTPFQQVLIDRGFVIADDRDELAEVRSRYHDRKGDTKGMSLTIAPTMSCNFGCGYCFQSHSKRRMGLEQIEDLIGFVAEKLAPDTYLAVTWFGGEPLSAFDVIEELAPRLHALATERGCRFDHSIITNGFLLTRERAEFLAGVPGFGYAQITLDGSKDLHDIRRPTLVGKGTFDRILRNVAGAADVLPITIRVNVDRRNIHTLETLLDTLVQEGLQGKVQVYLGHVWEYTAEVEPSDFLSIEDFATVETQFKLMKFRKGFSMGVRLPQPKAGAQCVADHPNGWVVGPTGLLFKCWNEVHQDAEAASGTLKDGGCDGGCAGSGAERMAANAVGWKNYDPFTHTPCQTCAVAPLCMSGCPWESAKTASEQTGFCTPLRFNLADELRLFDLKRTVDAGLQKASANQAASAATSSQASLSATH